MLRRSTVSLWRVHCGGGNKGGKNLVWKPKMPMLDRFVRTDMQHPKRRPYAWNRMEFDRLGFQTWPKEVGFWNAGDNWELTPEFQWRFYLHSRDADVWTQGHSEQTVVALMPLAESNPKEYVPRVEDVFRHHVKRFGADHVIYNAVMQALAFAKDYNRALEVYREMDTLGLEPNAQTYVNMMLACVLCAKPIDLAKHFWAEAVRTKAITPILRMDYEFDLWMKQFERLGSFTSGKGFLSTNEEGAVEVPRDMFALWGWDRDERKFAPRKDTIRQEIERQTATGKYMRGKLASGYARRPWFKYKGMFPWDYTGPRLEEIKEAKEHRERIYKRIPRDTDIPGIPYQSCGKAIQI